MRFERHHGILKEISISGVVRVLSLAKNLKVTEETIRSDLDELAGQGYLTRCHGGTLTTLDSLDNVAKNEIVYVLEKYESAQEIKKGLSTMKSNVCVIGSLNVDIISYLPRLPSTGESLLADKFIFLPGGKGCNWALAASYADSDVHLITKVGSDYSSDYAINFVNSSKIHKSVIYQTKETRTGTATIMVSGDTGNNVIAIYPGANTTISPDEITIQKGAIAHSDTVLVQLETNYEALQQTIRLAQKNDIPVIVNPASYNETVNTIIDDINYITPNETEAGLLANMSVDDIESAKCATKIIHQKGVKSTIITLGSKGSLAYDGTQFIYSPAFPTVVKSTAGADDTSSGTPVSGLAKGKSLASALCYVSAFASLAAETPNASDMPENESVLHRIQGSRYKQIISTHQIKEQIMNNTQKKLKVFFIGESWHIHIIHSKGYNSFTSNKYEEGAAWLLECLKKGSVEIDYMPAHAVQIVFPESIDELSRYDIIVISDIGSNMFLLQDETFYQLKVKSNVLEPIKEYVRNGDGLFMIGGYLSFTGIEAKANYKNIILAEVLPAIMLDGDDRIGKPEDICAEATSPEHPVVNGFSDYPVFLGYNQVVAREDTDVVLTINSDPLLVSGEYQQGKTACFMSDCPPHWGAQQFMSWPFYTDLWVNTLQSIARK